MFNQLIDTDTTNLVKRRRLAKAWKNDGSCELGPPAASTILQSTICTIYAHERPRGPQYGIGRAMGNQLDGLACDCRRICPCENLTVLRPSQWCLEHRNYINYHYECQGRTGKQLHYRFSKDLVVVEYREVELLSFPQSPSRFIDTQRNTIMTVAYPITAVPANKVTVVVSTCLLIMASLAVGLRMWARYLGSIGLGSDDYLILFSLVYAFRKSISIRKANMRSFCSFSFIQCLCYTWRMAWADTCPTFRRRMCRLSLRCEKTWCISYKLLIFGVIANDRLSNNLWYDPGCNKALIYDFLLSSIPNPCRLHEMGIRLNSRDYILVDRQHATSPLDMSTICKELDPNHTRPMWEFDIGIRHGCNLQYSNRCCDATASYAIHWVLADAKEEKVRPDSDVWSRFVVSQYFVTLCFES